MREIIGNTTTTPMPVSDWNQTDESKADYIKNKPTLGNLAFKYEVTEDELSDGVKALLDKANTALQSYTETDPTVPAWAKASTKPTYTASEVGAAASSHTHSANDIAKAGYLATHPELSTTTTIPFIYNDLAFLTLRGGSFSCYSTTSADLTAENLERGELNLSGADKLFNGMPSNAYLMTDGNYVTVIDLTLHKTFTYNNNFYIDFALPDFRAKNIDVYVMNKDTETTYTLKNSVTNNSKSFVFCAITHSSKNSEGKTVQGFNRLRIVLSNFNQSGSSYGRRIAEIGLVNYNSAGLSETYLSRGGCTGIYGSLIPQNNNSITLGNSSKKWSKVYATSFEGDLNGTATSIKDVTATATELNYMKGVTSNVQDQLNVLNSKLTELLDTLALQPKEN